RTVHSKVDGLKIFDNVKVDLVAPQELALQEHYVQRMIENGFEVRCFESIEEYISQKRSLIADKWYFTRLQLGRMSDDMVKISGKLRSMVTANRDVIDKMGDDFLFYHPRPTFKWDPVITHDLEDLSNNACNRQSQNGFLIRTALSGALAGVPYICDDFDGEVLEKKVYHDDFVQQIACDDKGPKEYKQGVKPIENGVVIDHIARGSSAEEIKYHISEIEKILELDGVGGSWVAKSKKDPDTHKGLIFLPGYEGLTEKQKKRLAARSPNCRVNVIENNQVKEKLLLHMPEQIYNFKQLDCKNDACISHSANGEPMSAHFYKKNGDFECKYCETPHHFKEVWKKE
ncbi:aspartate carbamoyltransferase regulatory subunit, partial [Candidatus Woesearchaeota archaeon]|nr:aspartate carbamoyltransferase regulatory subunit [Candidatus Woesearchaeota archaeon]